MTEAPTFYPVLSYRDAQAALDWLQEAFGFEQLFVTPGPDGSVAHAELGLGSGIVMLHTAARDGVSRPADRRAAAQAVYVAVADPDAHCERARAAGAEITRELEDTGYGLREYSARDPGGHHWHFGTYRPAPPEKESASRA
ncbi:MAG TPA: VOC family protein [Gaiellaceae bacterium]|nr:VOC family protein [Gaiellaceae bacterium]